MNANILPLDPGAAPKSLNRPDQKNVPDDQFSQLLSSKDKAEPKNKTPATEKNTVKAGFRPGEFQKTRERPSDAVDDQDEMADELPAKDAGMHLDIEVGFMGKPDSPLTRIDDHRHKGFAKGLSGDAVSEKTAPKIKTDGLVPADQPVMNVASVSVAKADVKRSSAGDDGKAPADPRGQLKVANDGALNQMPSSPAKAAPPGNALSDPAGGQLLPGAERATRPASAASANKVAIETANLASNPGNLPAGATNVSGGKSTGSAGLKEIPSVLSQIRSGSAAVPDAKDGTSEPLRKTADGQVDGLDGQSSTRPDPATSSLLTAIRQNSNWSRHVAEASAARWVDVSPKDGMSQQNLRLQLHPAELGAVTATIRMSGDRLSVSLRVENDETLQKLAQDKQIIQNTLRSLGFQIDEISITGGQQDQTAGGQNGDRGQHHTGVRDGDRDGGRDGRNGFIEGQQKQKSERENDDGDEDSASGIYI